VSVYRVDGLLVLSATIAFAQNSLIQPLADLQKDLKGKLETFEGDHNGKVPVNFQTKVLPFFSRELAFPK
jgi:hypothetical protein